MLASICEVASSTLAASSRLTTGVTAPDAASRTLEGVADAGHVRLEHEELARVDDAGDPAVRPREARGGADGRWAGKPARAGGYRRRGRRRATASRWRARRDGKAAVCAGAGPPRDAARHAAAARTASRLPHQSMPYVAPYRVM